jgi:hypothetical protein
MNQQADFQKLSAQLSRLEAEIAVIRQKMKALPQQSAQPTLRETATAYVLVDKIALKEMFAQILSDLDIQGNPIGAEALQQKMREARLERNELCQTIISMREE